jgi:HK97 family phage major capsid protein
VLFRSKVDIGSFSREFVYENGTATASWPGESTAATETTPTYTNITLTPKRLAAIVRVSNELIEDSGVRGGPTVMSMVQEQFARVLAQTEESALLPQTNVSGAPTSLFLTSSLPTSAASATAITADQIIDFVYKLPRQYRSHPSCAIVTSDSTLAALRKLAAVGGTANYFWQNGYQNVGAGAAGEPDRIMGIPVYVSAAVPAIATGNYIAMIGAWDYSIFASAQNFEFKVLRELYSPANETGFICNSRLDCKLLLPTLAFAALKCA